MTNPIMKGLLNAKPYEPSATYRVRIKATVTKDIVVTATDPDAAVEQAHELFTTNCDDTEERYEQDTVYVKQEEPDT